MKKEKIIMYMVSAASAAALAVMETWFTEKCIRADVEEIMERERGDNNETA